MEKETRQNGRRELEARFRMLEAAVEHANDVVVVTDSDTLTEPGPKVVFVNEAFVWQTGYEKKEILGKSPRILQGPKTDAATRARVRRALELGEPVREDMLNYRKDGTEYWVEMSIVPLRDSKGRITHWVSVQRDVTERRRAVEREVAQAREKAREAEAEAGERRLSGILDLMSDPFFTLDSEWRVIFANRAAELLVGGSRQQLVGAIPWPWLDHVLGEEARHLVERSRREAASVEGLVCSRQSARCFQLRALPVREGAAFFLHETTELEDHKAYERRLSGIVEATPDVVSSATADGQLLFLNRAGYELLGVPEKTPADRARIQDGHPEWAWQKILSEGMPTALERGSWEGETALRRPDGTEIPVSQVILAHREGGGEVVFSTIIRDISAQKEVAEDLRFLASATRELNSTLDSRIVMETSARLAVRRIADWCLIAVTDEPEARCVGAHSDPAKLQMLDELSQGSLGATCLPLGLEEVLRVRQPRIVESVTDTWMRQAEPSPDRQETLVRLGTRSLVLLPLEAYGQVLGAMVMAFGKPERSYREREVYLAKEYAVRVAMALENTRLYEQSVKAMQARDDVLSVVSHDLRSPLQSVSLAASLIAEQVEEAGLELQDTVKLIQRSVTRATRLVEDLLEATRAEAGHLELALESSHPYEVLWEAIALNVDAAERRQVSVEPESTGETPDARMDRKRVVQVLTNLIENAVRYSPVGERVLVRLAHDRAGIIYSVEDRGPGISPRDQTHLFERFWKADQEGPGFGLGLAICKGIVDAHGGRIWVESTPKVGSTFHVWLPLSPPPKSRQY